MEAAGLAFGALALVGVFKDCLDLISMISQARSLDRDIEILDTKLDIEKLLLLQWADKVGLVRPGYDRRLDDPEINKTVGRVLSSIRGLVTESKVLEERYGLRKFDPFKDAAGIEDQSHASASRMARFLRDFENLAMVKRKFKNKIELRNDAGRSTIRWVISDKAKFNGLIVELSYFNSRLDALVPVNTRSVFDMSEADFKYLHSNKKLQMIAEVTTGREQSIVDAANHVIIQNRVRDRIWFRWMDDRKANIHQAHEKTLEWALKPPQESGLWDDLNAWLQDNTGIYWVSGKAGSGKSTLMKYLYSNPQTSQLLQTWARSSKLICANFFFYHLGKPEQKSQEGLLRGLLYQVLFANPKLIEIALPEMWKEAISLKDNLEKELAMPSIAEMQTALLNLGNREDVDTKIFYLIDGLDEYDGRYMDAATFFKTLGKCPNVKVLVSSRPLAAFVATFGNEQKMRLQDLTKGDIDRYIEDTITSHSYMFTLSTMDPKGCEKIIAELIDKAAGVFLWVILACRSLLEGFAAFDSVGDLQGRVDELPPELEELFALLLSKIERRWRQQALKLLRILYDNQNKMTADLHESKTTVDRVPTLALALGDEVGFATEPRKLKPPSSVEARRLQCRMMEGRLRSRCWGLLEIQEARHDHRHSCACEGGSQNHDKVVDSAVVFMHRSVYEFLCIPAVWQQEPMYIEDKGFNTHSILCMMWTEFAAAQESQVENKFGLGLRNALLHAQFSQQTGCTLAALSCSFVRIQSIVVRYAHGQAGGLGGLAKIYLPHKPECGHYRESWSIALAFACEMGLTELVTFALENPNLLTDTVKAISDAPQRPARYSCTTSTGSTGSTGCQDLYRENLKLGVYAMSPYTVLPMLHHAACQPMLRLLRSALENVDPDYTYLNFEEVFPDLPNLDLVRYLDQAGHSPKQQFFYSKASPVTTIWQSWREFTPTYDTPKDIEMTHTLLRFGRGDLDAGSE